MPAGVTLNSWGDPIKTNSSSGEKVWGDVETPSEAVAGSGPPSTSRPTRPPPSSGRPRQVQYDGPDVEFTQQEAALHRWSYKAFTYALGGGALSGGIATWVILNRRKVSVGPRVAFSLLGALGGIGIAPSVAGPWIKYKLDQVEDRAHFNAALQTWARRQEQKFDRHMDAARSAKMNAPHQQQSQGGFGDAPQPLPEKQLQSSSRPAFGSQTQQRQPQQAPASSPPAPADDPFSTSSGDDSGSSAAPTSNAHNSSRWAQIRGESAPPQSSWDRLRQSQA